VLISLYRRRHCFLSQEPSGDKRRGLTSFTCIGSIVGSGFPRTHTLYFTAMSIFGFVVSGFMFVFSLQFAVCSLQQFLKVDQDCKGFNYRIVEWLPWKYVMVHFFLVHIDIDNVLNTLYRPPLFRRFDAWLFAFDPL
jgi:hypothetical protein